MVKISLRMGLVQVDNVQYYLPLPVLVYPLTKRIVCSFFLLAVTPVVKRSFQYLLPLRIPSFGNEAVLLLNREELWVPDTIHRLSSFTPFSVRMHKQF